MKRRAVPRCVAGATLARVPRVPGDNRGRVAPVWAFAAVLAAASGYEGAAHAFCRTTTIMPPVGYDPAVSGCWKAGTPLVWSSDRAPFGIAQTASQQVSLAEATRIADAAFQAWNDATCDGKPLGLQAYDDGPITMVPDGSYLIPAGSDASTLSVWASCTESDRCDARAHDVIVFDDDAWPHDDPVNTLALTTVTYGATDGRIFEAYTEVNSAQKTLLTTEPPAGGGYDLQAILTHEAGHFFGLAHATDPSAVMYAYYQPGAIQLTPDDVAGICSVQPPAAAHDGCSAAGRDAGNGLALAMAPLAAFAMVRRRRRSAAGRRGDRVA